MYKIKIKKKKEKKWVQNNNYDNDHNNKNSLGFWDINGSFCHARPALTLFWNKDFSCSRFFPFRRNIDQIQWKNQHLNLKSWVKNLHNNNNYNNNQNNNEQKKENLQNYWLYCTGWPQNKTERKWTEDKNLEIAR